MSNHIGSTGHRGPIDGPEAVGGQADAAETSNAGEGAQAPAARASSRPRSLDMSGLDLHAQLEAKLNAKAEKDAALEGSFFRSTGLHIDDPDAPAKPAPKPHKAQKDAALEGSFFRSTGLHIDDPDAPAKPAPKPHKAQKDAALEGSFFRSTGLHIDDPDAPAKPAPKKGGAS